MYNTNNPFYAGGEYLIGFLLAAISVFSIALGFLFGARDVAHYLRMRSI